VYEASRLRKEGFRPQWEGLYKKRDSYKEIMTEYFKEEAKKEFKDLMSQVLSNAPLELMQQLASAMFVPQMITQPPQMQAQPPSSIDCTTVPSLSCLLEIRSTIQLMTSQDLWRAP
jgi:hypothetical protein